MAATIVTAQGISPGLPGGVSAAYNVSAAQNIKAAPGVLAQLACITGGTGVTLNDANVLVTAQTITAITKTASAVITLSTGGASNPFAVGNTIAFASIGGMTQMNSLIGTVTAIGGVTTAWTVTVNINSTNFTTYTSGGTAASFSAQNEIWSGALAAGQVVTLNWPCANGITLSAVTTAVFSISFS